MSQKSSTPPARVPAEKLVHDIRRATRWLSAQGIQHVRGAPAHPQTQGKIERWHQTMKNRILLEN